MIRHMNWIRSLHALTALAAMSAGCSAASTEESAESVAADQQDLAAYQFTDWTAWSMPINICSRRFTTTEPELAGEVPSVAEYTRLAVLVRESLNQTWGLVPGVSFVDRGTCSGDTSTFLKFEIRKGGGGACGAGVGVTCIVNGTVATVFEENVFKRLVAHESGHALGMGHEHQRTGTEFTSCSAERVAACERCKASIDSGGACAAADWNACGDPPVTTAQVFARDSAQYKLIEAHLLNNAPVPTFVKLTEYDPLSVMNYCASDNGRPADDYHLTRLDRLGLEMTYPLNTVYPIGCERGCILGDGSVITRTDGAITTDWRMRGGNTAIITGTGDVQWKEASTIAQGTSVVSFLFKAPRTSSLTTRGTVTNSDGAHTAVLNTLL